MAVYAGPLPSDGAYETFKRSTKKQRQSYWNPTNGWRKFPTKTKNRKLTASSGAEIEVPEDDYQDYMTFFRAANDELISENYEIGGKRMKSVVTPADYVDYAFGKNTKSVPTEQAGVGHIKYMWYAGTYQVLKVQFWNDTVVAYFRVPRELAATLFVLAQNGTTRMTARGERHLLGIYFWDLIRIRGAVNGSRYKFVYVQDNNTGGLPGRPYGSGKYFWEPTKDLIAELQAEKDFAKGLQHVINKDKAKIDRTIAEEYDSDPETAAKLYAIYNAASNIDTEALERAIDNLQNAINQSATRNAYTKVGERVTEANMEDVPTPVKELEDSTNILTGAGFDLRGNPMGLTDKQKQEIADAMQAHNAGKMYNENKATYERQKSAIEQHNIKRLENKYWTADRIDTLVNELASKNAFGPGGVDWFNTRFPNYTEQFDFLKRRGMIPSDARYIE